MARGDSLKGFTLAGDDGKFLPASAVIEGKTVIVTGGAAAIALHMQQPPLSQQIRALEQEIGAALLLRHPRGVSLTDAGRSFLADAEAILADIQKQYDDVAKVAQRFERNDWFLRGEFNVGKPTAVRIGDARAKDRRQPQGHGRDGRDVVLRHPGVPVRRERRRGRLLPELRAELPLAAAAGDGVVREEGRDDPRLEHEPAAEVDAEVRRGGRGGRRVLGVKPELRSAR